MDKEIIKSIVTGGGGEGERQAAAQTLPRLVRRNNCRHLEGYKELGGAQLRDLKVQYENGTYHKRNDFDDKLIPESKEYLNKVEAAARNAASAAGPKDGDRKQFKQGWGVFLTANGFQRTSNGRRSS